MNNPYGHVEIDYGKSNLARLYIGPYEIYVKHTEDYGDKPETYLCLSYSIKGLSFYDSIAVERKFWEIDELRQVNPFKATLFDFIRNNQHLLPPVIYDQLLELEKLDQLAFAELYKPEPHVRNK